MLAKGQAFEPPQAVRRIATIRRGIECSWLRVQLAGAHVSLLGALGCQPTHGRGAGSGIASIWFDNPARMATVLGLLGAGFAFALQRVITAVAGYPDQGTRDIKERMTGDLLAALGQAGISLASTSYEITKIPPLRIERATSGEAKFLGK